MAYINGKSGYFDFQDVNKHFTWRINWSETYDIALNSSIVQIDSIQINSALYGGRWYPHAFVFINDEQVAELNYYKPTHTYSADTSAGFKNIEPYGSSGKAFPFIASVIPHNADGKKSISIAIKNNPAGKNISSIQLYRQSDGIIRTFGANQTQTVELTNIPRAATITGAPNFTDEEYSLPITYTNPAGSAVDKLEVCISLTGARADIPYQEVSRTGTNYTITLTPDQMELLRQNTLNGSSSRQLYFILQTTIGGATYRSPLEKTFTVVNAEPLLSVFLMDTNSTTAALTGDSLTTVVKGYSNFSYEMNAEPQKGATITALSATNGSTTLETDSGVFTGVTSKDFRFSATDNRGLITQKSFALKLIDYFKPTCNAEATLELDGETTARAAITITGTFFNGSFGAVKNDIEILVKHSAANRWISLTKELYFEPSIKENTYSIDFGISDLDYSQPFTYQCKVIDKLAEATSAEETKNIFPLFDWSETEFNFNVPVTFQKGFTVVGEEEDSGGGFAGVDYIIEQGTEAMGSNGTWYWEKWANGKAVCYGTRNFGNMAVSTAWGSMYYSAVFSQPFPNGLFIAAPDYCDMRFAHANNAAADVWKVGGNDTTANSTGQFNVVRPTSYTLEQVYISFHAIGRWK